MESLTKVHHEGEANRISLATSDVMLCGIGQSPEEKSLLVQQTVVLIHQFLLIWQIWARRHGMCCQ